MVVRLAGNRRRSGSAEFRRSYADLRPAERQPDVAATGEFAVTGTTVDLQNTPEALQLSS
jgi:hypothetical protein